MTKIEIYSFWTFIGSSPNNIGFGKKHKIIDICGNQITTWSEPETTDKGGFSWLGSKEEFVKNFKLSENPRHIKL